MIELGQAYEGTFTVRDEDAQLADPVTASCTISLPDGTTADVPVPLPSDVPGKLRITYRPTMAGLHKASYAASFGSEPDIASSDYFNVREYISALSIAEARDRLQEFDVPDDTIRLFCAAATRLTEQRVGSVVVRKFTDDEIPGSQARSLRLPHGPVPSADAVTSVSSVWPGGPSWSSAGLIVSVRAGRVRRADGLPFTDGPWLSTYLGGRQPVDENISAGCAQILWDLWGIMRGATRDTDVPELIDLPAIEAGYQLSPIAAELLGGELQATANFA